MAIDREVLRAFAEEMEKDAFYMNFLTPHLMRGTPIAPRVGGRGVGELVRNIGRKVAPRAPQTAAKMTDIAHAAARINPQAAGPASAAFIPPKEKVRVGVGGLVDRAKKFLGRSVSGKNMPLKTQALGREGKFVRAKPAPQAPPNATPVISFDPRHPATWDHETRRVRSGTLVPDINMHEFGHAQDQTVHGAGFFGDRSRKAGRHVAARRALPSEISATNHAIRAGYAGPHAAAGTATYAAATAPRLSSAVDQEIGAAALKHLQSKPELQARVERARRIAEIGGKLNEKAMAGNRVARNLKKNFRQVMAPAAKTTIAPLEHEANPFTNPEVMAKISPRGRKLMGKLQRGVEGRLTRQGLDPRGVQSLHQATGTL